MDRPTDEGIDEGTQALLSRSENTSKQGQIGSVKWTDDQRFMSKREGANVLKYIYMYMYIYIYIYIYIYGSFAKEWTKWWFDEFCFFEKFSKLSIGAGSCIL